MTPKSATTVRLEVEIEPTEDFDKRRAWDGMDQPQGFWSAETYAISLGLQFPNITALLKEFSMVDFATVYVVDDLGRRHEVKFR